jgi:hypothetical protein
MQDEPLSVLICHPPGLTIDLEHYKVWVKEESYWKKKDLGGNVNK